MRKFLLAIIFSIIYMAVGISMDNIFEIKSVEIYAAVFFAMGGLYGIII